MSATFVNPDELNPCSTLSAILLAAGESRRMGTNKLLLEIEGESLVLRTAKMLRSCGFAEVVVVLGHESDAVAARLAELPLRTVLNQRYTEGQQTSVLAGLGALEQASAGVMICLADQPHLTKEDLSGLARSFHDQGGELAIVPRYLGARGNPVVLATAHVADVLSRGNFGCRRFIDRNPDLVVPYDAPNDHFVSDLDAPEDVANLESSESSDSVEA